MTLVNRTGAPRTLANMTEGLPVREPIQEPTPQQRLDFDQAELKALDVERVRRNAIRGRLNLEEMNDEKKRAFLLARLARNNPQPESPKVMATWADEMTTPAHQWDQSGKIK
jgi:hypothetical protein